MEFSDLNYKYTIVGTKLASENGTFIDMCRGTRYHMFASLCERKNAPIFDYEVGLVNSSLRINKFNFANLFLLVFLIGGMLMSLGLLLSLATNAYQKLSNS